MNNKELKTEEFSGITIDIIEAEEVKEDSLIEVDELAGIDFSDLIPEEPNKIVTDVTAFEEKSIVSDDAILGLYDEILENCREDRAKADGLLNDFSDMVINSGDSSSATKEALVALMKIKSDSADKMTKVADLMTRIKLKEKNTFPPYMAKNQQNNTMININQENGNRSFLKSLNSKIK